MNGKQINIMLIEDNPGDVRLIQEMLKSTAVQFRLDCSDRLSTGFQLLGGEKFDVLILDLGLPDTKGLETLKKALANVSEIPVIVLTGLADEAIGIRAIQDGAQDYLIKGQIDGNLLMRAIRYSIERKRIKKALQKAHDELEWRIEERTAELTKLNDQLKAEVEIRKQAEEALQKSEEKYRTVADFTYDWEDWLDPNGKYIYISPSCEWVSGYRPDEFIADPKLLIKITHPEDCDLIEKHFRDILSGSIAISYIDHIDFRIITRSGEVRWISHYCQPVYGKDGNFLGRRASNRDITKRKESEEELKRLMNELEHFNVELSTSNEQLKKEIEVRTRTEKALKESEERYKRMVSAVTAYTYSVDLRHAGAISTRHSKGCIPVTGYKPEDYETDPYLWRSMIYPDDWLMVENSIKEILSGHEVPPIEHRIVRLDGKVVWVRNTIAPYYDGDGRLIRYDGLIEDITERKVAEEEIKKLNKELEQHIFELREANRELDAFNHTVSHDLQNPLIIIRWFADRLMKNIQDRLDTNEKDMLNTIQTSIQKMDGLIKDLLSFSRFSHQKIEPKEINMTDLITTVLDELKPLSEGRIIKFNIRTLPPAYGDIGLLKQVLINLISNAVKFTRSKEMAVIEVGCRIAEKETVYYVRDNGMGFYSQYADKLFSVFYRQPDAKTFEGTGIGLSIVQSIISRHGGRVWAEGKVNEGATFYFSLPNEISEDS